MLPCCEVNAASRVVVMSLSASVSIEPSGVGHPLYTCSADIAARSRPPSSCRFQGSRGSDDPGPDLVCGRLDEVETGSAMACGLEHLPDGPGSPRPASGRAARRESQDLPTRRDWRVPAASDPHSTRASPPFNRPYLIRVFSGVAAGVLVLGRVTAQHFPVRHAHPQVNPRVTERQARLAARGRGADIPDLVQVTTRSPR